MKKKKNELLRDMIIVITSSAIGSYAIVAVMLPNGLTSGGITGIARIAQQAFGFNYTLAYYIACMIIVAIVWIFLGFGEVKKIIAMSIAYPVMITIFQACDLRLLQTKDLFLACIYFGILFGISSGILFYGGFSSGGTDSLAKVVRNKLFPHVPLSTMVTVFDLIIIIVSGFVIGVNIALYGIVQMVVMKYVTDLFIYGMSGKVVRISAITSASDELTDFVMHEVGRGVTSCTVKGEYSGEEKKELMIYCTPRESVEVKRFLAEKDPAAFVTIMQVNTVWGEGKGFQDINKSDVN
jgi:uncharacterized membrane-anchored protein YitT (DUF2179 family)